MRRDPRDLVQAAIRCNRSPKIVGAGIGYRRVGDATQGDPTLTILTRGPATLGEVKSGLNHNRGLNLPVDILDVGDVVALTKV